jgi:hypothetical protein
VINSGYHKEIVMIRVLEKKIAKFITEKIPDPIKLVFFYSLAFVLGYVAGSFIYENAELTITKICEAY